MSHFNRLGDLVGLGEGQSLPNTMKRHLIYALLDPGTEDVRYVGRSSLGMGRPRYHVKHAWEREADGSWTSQLYVHAWIRSLGERRPDIRILEEFEPADDVSDRLNEAEVRWISDLRSQGHRLTNLTEGGGGVLGHRHTDEVKARIAEAGRNQVWTEERKQKIAKAVSGPANALYGKGPMFGKNHSDETKARLAAAQLGTKRPGQSGDAHWTARAGHSPNQGREFSAEWRANISAAQLGKTHPNRKGLRVRELNSGLEFDQATQAAAHFGVSKSTVCRCVVDGVERRGLRFTGV